MKKCIGEPLGIPLLVWLVVGALGAMVGLGIQYMAQEKVPTLETTDKSVILFVGTEPICRCPISAEQWAAMVEARCAE
jgi:hypothetical protein